MVERTTCAFRAFLGRATKGFAVVAEEQPPEQRPWQPAEPFGIVDQTDRSVALWNGGSCWPMAARVQFIAGSDHALDDLAAERVIVAGRGSSRRLYSIRLRTYCLLASRRRNICE